MFEELNAYYSAPGRLAGMKDEQLFHLSKFVRIDGLLQNDYVFREDDRSMDFYVVRDGRIEIRKETPFGPQILGEFHLHLDGGLKRHGIEVGKKLGQETHAVLFHDPGGLVAMPVIFETMFDFRRDSL